MACTKYRTRPLFAAESLARAVTQRPEMTIAWYRQALVLAELGRTEDALASLNTVLSIDPTHAEALAKRAALLS